jgi:hypothetical protein
MSDCNRRQWLRGSGTVLLGGWALSQRARGLSLGATTAGSAGIAAGTDDRVRRTVYLLDDLEAEDGRDNLRGYRTVFPSLRRFDRRAVSEPGSGFEFRFESELDGPRRLILPVEIGLSAPEQHRLLDAIQAGAHVLVESPALLPAGRRSDWPALLGIRERALVNTFSCRAHGFNGGEDVGPYLRAVSPARVVAHGSGASFIWLRHDSEVVPIHPPGGRGASKRPAIVITTPSGCEVIAAVIPVGRGRVLYSGTRLGSPLFRGESAIVNLLHDWLD